MGWRRGGADRDGEMLKRIVALLLSLAVLAEHAAGVSGRRRRGEVLSILLWGEAEARAFVIGLATGGMVLSGTQAPVEAFAPSSDLPASSSDAAQCAVRLRALAMLLCLLLAGALARHATGSRVAQEDAGAGIATQLSAALPALDTS